MSEAIGLKPCPFCGEKARFEVEYFGDSSLPSYRIGCTEHSLDYWEDQPHLVAKEWNKRI